MSLHTPPAPSEIILNDREQIQYLLGNPPSWMMRYGISTMAGFFVLLLSLAYFIRYPDVVEAKIVLTTANPPIRIMARTGGRITELLVTEKELVQKDQVLAVIENTDNRRDVLRLETWLNSANIQQENLPEGLTLGSLQAAYSTLSQHWNDYHYFSTNPGIPQRIAAIYQQTDRLQDINTNLSQQKAIMEQEFVLTTKERDRQAKLFADKVISELEYEKSESAWLQQKRQIAASESTVLQNQLQIRQLEGQVKELLQTKSDSRNDKELILAEDLQRLRSEIATWKQTYLITAPICGRVSFHKIWSTQQAIAAGEESFAIVPDDTAGINSGRAHIIGRAAVAGPQFGRIQPDMRVVIRLDGFPAQQYGVIEGFITNLAALPQKEEAGEAYLVEVNLSDTLNTSYGKPIPFRQEMTGVARIVTEDRRVLERIFDRLNDLVKNR